MGSTWHYNNPMPLTNIGRQSPAVNTTSVNTNTNDVNLPLLSPTSFFRGIPDQPTQETHDLLAFERDLLNTTFSCQDCGSKKHASGLCKQRDAIFHTSADLVALEDVPIMEQGARQQLSKGLTLEMPMCELHQEKALKELREQGISWQPGIVVPGSADGLISKTALLPVCWDCFAKQTFQLPNTPIAKLDTCVCAANIMSMDCWACAIQRVDLTKCTAVNNRTHSYANGRAIVSCACGAVVTTGFARKCVGCDGTVTLPAANFAGDKVSFTAGQADGSVKRTKVTQKLPKQTASAATIHGHDHDADRITYQSVRDMMGRPSKYEPVAAQQRGYTIFTAGEISALRGCGLNIAGPIRSNDVDDFVNPRRRLAKLVESLAEPLPHLDVKTANAVLTTCGFDVAQLSVAMETLRNEVWKGEVRADCLEIFAFLALNNVPEPSTAETAWMDECDETGGAGEETAENGVGEGTQMKGRKQVRFDEDAKMEDA